MPLSDKEQQIFQEIQKQLQDDDPKFARRTKSLEGQPARNAKRGILLFSVGFLGLMGFLFTQQVLVGVAGFLVMLAGATLAFYGSRKSSGDSGGPLRKLFGPPREKKL